MSGTQKSIFSLLLIGIASLLYGQFLWNPLVFDDLPFFMVNAAGHQPVDDYQFSFLELRSLPYATLAWTKELFGLELLYFRIGNLLLHAFVAISLFHFLSKLFEIVLGKSDANRLNHDALAFSAALLFVLHPVAVYAAGYLVQRTILMATLFAVLAMLAWLQGIKHGRNNWLLVSVLLYYFSVFSKEHSIMLPLVLVAITVLAVEDWQQKLRSVWKYIFAMFLIAFFVLLAKRGILGQVYELAAPEMLATQDGSMNYLLSVMTQTWLFFKYAGMWVLPNPHWMSVDMREPFAVTIWSEYLVAMSGFVIFGVGATWLLLKRGRLGLLGFAMLFPWLMFMPELSTVRIQESFVLYRSYLWAVGACALLPLLLCRLDKKMSLILIAAIVLAMLPVSMDRLASFSHAHTLWDDAAKLVRDKDDLPGVDRIYNNRGLENLKLQYYSEAIDDFMHSIKLNSNMPSAFTNLGAAYLETGRFKDAEVAFDHAIEIIRLSGKQMSANPFYGKAKALEAMDRRSEAKENYEISCSLARKGCEKLAQ